MGSKTAAHSKGRSKTLIKMGTFKNEHATVLELYLHSTCVDNGADQVTSH